MKFSRFVKTTILIALFSLLFSFQTAFASSPVTLTVTTNNDIITATANTSSGSSIKGIYYFWDSDTLSSFCPSYSTASYSVNIPLPQNRTGKHILHIFALDNAVNFSTVHNIDYTINSSAKPFSAIATSPSANSTGVSITPNILIHFDRPLNIAPNYKVSVRPAEGPDDVSFAAQPALINNKTALSITVKPLRYNTKYRVTIAGGSFKDADGNLSNALDFFFTTSAQAPLKTFNVASTTPAANAVGVDINPSIAVNFGRVVSKTSDYKVIVCPAEGVDDVEFASNPKLTQNNTVLSLSLKPLRYNTRYRVIVVAGSFKDSNGNLSSAVDYYFTTAASPVNAFGPVSMYPSINAGNIPINPNILIKFGRTVSYGPNYKVSVYPAEGPDDVAFSGKPTLTSNNKEFSIKVKPLRYNTKYRIVIPAGAFKDSKGNLSSEIDYYFTTEMTPKYTFAAGSTFPSKNAVGVTINPTISIDFDRKVYKTPSYSVSVFPAEGVDDVKFASEPTLSSSKKVFSVPVKTLRYNTKYRVIVGAGSFKDSTGRVNEAIDFTFTTQLEPSRFKAILTTPAENSEGVSVKPNITIDFGYKVSKTSDYKVVVCPAEGVDDVVFASQPELIHNNTVLSISVNRLRYNTKYKVFVAAGSFKDSNGNLSEQIEYYFTTTER